MPCKLKAHGRSKSINSFRVVRSTTAMSIPLTILRPTGRSDRTPFAVIRDTTYFQRVSHPSRAVVTRSGARRESHIVTAWIKSKISRRFAGAVRGCAQ
jgi:hypothetical protein